MGSSNLNYFNDWGSIKTPSPAFEASMNTMVVTIIYK